MQMNPGDGGAAAVQARTKYHPGSRTPHDRDGNIEYLATRTIPELNTTRGKKLHIPIPDILAEKYQEKSARHSNEMRLCLLGL